MFLGVNIVTKLYKINIYNLEFPGICSLNQSVESGSGIRGGFRRNQQQKNDNKISDLYFTLNSNFMFWKNNSSREKFTITRCSLVGRSLMIDITLLDCVQRKMPVCLFRGKGSTRFDIVTWGGYQPTTYSNKQEMVLQESHAKAWDDTSPHHIETNRKWFYYTTMLKHGVTPAHIMNK